MSYPVQFGTLKDFTASDTVDEAEPADYGAIVTATFTGLITTTGGQAITYTTLAIGTIIPLAIKRVNATGLVGSIKKLFP